MSTAGSPFDNPVIRVEYLSFQWERIERAINTNNPFLIEKVLKQLRDDGFPDLAAQIINVILKAALADALLKGDEDTIRMILGVTKQEEK